MATKKTTKPATTETPATDNRPKTIEEWLERQSKTGFITTSAGKIHSVTIRHEIDPHTQRLSNAVYVKDCSAVEIIGDFSRTAPVVTKSTSMCVDCAAVLAEREKLTKK